MGKKESSTVDLEFESGLLFKLGFIVSLIFLTLLFISCGARESKTVDGELSADSLQKASRKSDASVNGADGDSSHTVASESGNKKEQVAPIFLSVEEMPEFPGGDKALTQYLRSIEYPAKDLEEGCNGKIYLSFVVNEYGLIEQVKVLRKVDPILDSVALKHIMNMPRWSPGKHNGKPVKVSFNRPIIFKLTE